MISASRPRALVTLADTAHPVNTGKRLRAASVVRGLAEHLDIDVIVLFADHPVDRRPLPPDVHAGSWRVVSGRRAPLGPAAAALARRRPWRIAGYDWRDARAAFGRLAASGYDLVWFGELDHFVALRDLVPAPPCIVDCDDVEPAKIDSYLALPAAGSRDRMRRLQYRMERRWWQRLQQVAARDAHALVVCSALDVGRLGPPAVAVPNTYPDRGPCLQRPPDRPTFLLVANFGYLPNLDAARYAVEQVLPALRARLPDAVLMLAGRQAAERLAALRATAGVQIHDNVPDVGWLLAQATAVLVPVRFGGGTRLKIVEAFAHGVPVVSTPLGAEGLAVNDGIELLLADDADGLAAACARLAADDTLRNAVAAAGRRCYMANYRPQVAHDRIAALVRQTLLTGDR